VSGNTNKIQVYTGEGKGKTTASLGLLLRFLGSGGQACLIQFDKGAGTDSDFYQERKLFPLLSGLKFFPTGMVRFNAEKNTFRFNNISDDFQEAQRGLKLAQEAFNQGYGLVVLDELLSLILTDLVKKEEIIALLDAYETAGRPCELVITGHRIWPELEARVDLITEMKKLKHYFDQGLQARKGIEF
jgi:cob(I)alamin adenosyltransferase